MRIPKKIDFLGHPVKISLVSGKEIEKDGVTDGSYNSKKLEIKIDKKLLPTKREEVLFHEIGEMLANHLRLTYHETSTHDGFSKYHDLLWTVLKQNKLI